MASLTGTEIVTGLGQRGIAVTLAEADRLAHFLALLEQWNRVHNLTSIRRPSELLDRHLVESLALAEFVSGPDAADIGSGGGLPGIPLAIRLPQIRFTLIESRRKRVSFLRHVVATLGLRNVTVAHGRAEQLELGPFATVLARAVAGPSELLAIAAPLVGPDGRLVFLTSADKARELVELATGFAAVEPAGQPDSLQSRIVVLVRELS